jgi:hypothetical protein
MIERQWVEQAAAALCDSRGVAAAFQLSGGNRDTADDNGHAWIYMDIAANLQTVCCQSRSSSIGPYGEGGEAGPRWW